MLSASRCCSTSAARQVGRRSLSLFAVRACATGQGEVTEGVNEGTNKGWSGIRSLQDPPEREEAVGLPLGSQVRGASGGAPPAPRWTRRSCGLLGG
eukprot:3290290-Pyramimonas_sp.AAC.1